MPPEMRHDPKALQQCPLCGYRFDKPVEVCGACPLHDRCRVESCPHCGYQFVTRSSVVDFFRRLSGRGSEKRARAGGQPEEAPAAAAGEGDEACER